MTGDVVILQFKCNQGMRHFYLHVNGLQSVHNAGIQLIHNLELTTCNNQDFKMFVGNLGQLLLPEFIGKLLADSDAVFVA